MLTIARYKAEQMQDAFRKAMGRRLKAARDASPYSQKTLGEACGWENAQGRISNYERGESEPTFYELDTMCKLLGAEPSYIAFGGSALTEDERELLRLYRTATSHDKNIIRTTAIACSSRSAVDRSTNRKGRKPS